MCVAMKRLAVSEASNRPPSARPSRTRMSWRRPTCRVATQQSCPPFTTVSRSRSWDDETRRSVFKLEAASRVHLALIWIGRTSSGYAPGGKLGKTMRPSRGTGWIERQAGTQARSSSRRATLSQRLSGGRARRGRGAAAPSTPATASRLCWAASLARRAAHRP